ncbi:MAG: B12-binding domain-containing radical SAM protein, partial [Syntrophobacteraceae bacterium]
MKILLIYPYFLEERNEEENISAVPIGLYYLAALLLQEGYDAEISNFYRSGSSPQGIREILAQKNADIVGISVFNANRWGGIETARIVKEVNPDAKIVFGGVGATFLWDHFLRNFREIDYVVLGEGEYSFLHLVRLLDNGSRGDLAAIKGIAFRNGSQIVRTAPADPIQDLDKLPNPARYFAYKHLSLTRGCPGNCTYCGSPRFWGHKVRFHSVSYFVDQLELLYRKGISFFYISDDIFTMKKDLVIAVCKEILSRGLSISWYAISHVNNVDEEILYWMRKAGCIQISYGVESGSEKIRKKLNKRIRNEQVERAFSLTTRFGILARAYIILPPSRSVSPLSAAPPWPAPATATCRGSTCRARTPAVTPAVRAITPPAAAWTPTRAQTSPFGRGVSGRAEAPAGRWAAGFGKKDALGREAR